MAWGKAGSTTLTCSGTDLSVTSMTNSKTGMALGLHSSGGTAIKLNGENGTNGSGNYAVRRSVNGCLLYTSPSPRDRTRSRMPSSA